MFEGQLELSGAAEPLPAVDRLRAAARAEARAAAERLAAISDLYVAKVRQCGQAETWAADTFAAVAAEVAAALNIRLGLAGSCSLRHISQRELSGRRR